MSALDVGGLEAAVARLAVQAGVQVGERFTTDDLADLAEKVGVRPHEVLLRAQAKTS